MTLLITPAFFVADLTIPNIGNPKVDERVNSYITRLEPQCLELILGKALYASYMSDAATLRMLELINGVDYLVNGATFHWNGLKEYGNVSLVAYYIYFYMMKDMATMTTGIGEKVVITEDTKAVSSGDKRVSAWNNFSKRANNLISFLWNNASYPEVNWSQLVNLRNKIRPINSFGI